jgi:putative endonuclease
MSLSGKHVELGRAGERAAAAWYEAHGYEVLARNVRGDAGEVDLIVSRGTDLVVVEVKTRRGTGYGSGAWAVGPEKQRRIRAVTAGWLRESGRTGDVRFDVAELTWRAGAGGSFAVEIIEAAF